MRRYLLDTNHAGELLRDQSRLWERIAGAADAEFSLCRPSIGELWFMVFNSARIDENRTKLEALLARMVIWEYDAEAAIEYGRIRVELRKNGTPVPAIDALIAAIARTRALTLLTSDSHFGSIQALQTEDWLT